MFYFGHERRQPGPIDADGRRQERTSLHVVFPGGKLSVVTGSHFVGVLLGVIIALGAVLAFVLRHS